MAGINALWRMVSLRPSRPLLSGASSVIRSASVTQTVKGKQPRPYKDIPGPRGIYRWPIVGTLMHFKPFTQFTSETFNLFLDSMFDKYGPIFRLQLGRPTIITGVPEDAETVFRHEGKYPVRPATDVGVVYCKRNNIKLTLVELQNEEWQALRSSLNKRMMKVDAALHYLEGHNSVADEFVEALANPSLTAEDISDLFFRYTSECIGQVCFNTRLGFLDQRSHQDPETVAFLEASRDVFKYLNDTVSGQSVAHVWYRNKTYQGYEKARLVIRANAMKHTQRAKQVLEKQNREGTLNPEEPNLLLSLVSDDSLQSEDISNMIETLYAAGNDSTAKSLQALFFNLAANPDKQEKLRQEVTSVLGRDKPLTVKAMGKMPYLKACVKESFRLLYPTVSGTMRVLPTDVVLSGYTVPAGVSIGLHNPRMCKDYFVDSEKFIPERWIRGDGGCRHEDTPTVANLPFSMGPRNCIGKRFAEQEIYLGAAKVLQKLKIEVEPESYKTRFVYHLFVIPEKPIKFKFTKVEH